VVLVLLSLLSFLNGCMLPNTYNDPFDSYAYGRRWYDRGKYDLAAKYWDPLVEKGDCDAEYWEGVLYLLGRAKPKDVDKAVVLWRHAAEGNQPKAQAALGDLYYQNDAIVSHRCKACVNRDLVQAYVWYRLLEKSARYQGEKKYAKEVLASIMQEMTAAQLVEGDEKVRSWKPTNLTCKPRHWW
jgi:uncharacterized protein